MESITIGQIMSVCGAIVTIAGFVAFFYKMFINLKKYLTKIIVTELEPIKEKMDSLDEKIDKTDMEACKNYLVRFLADVERGNLVDEIDFGSSMNTTRTKAAIAISTKKSKL